MLGALVAEDAGRAARRLTPSVQVEIVPRAHHVAAVAQPEAVSTCLLRFLQERDLGV